MVAYKYVLSTAPVLSAVHQKPTFWLWVGPCGREQTPLPTNSSSVTLASASGEPRASMATPAGAVNEYPGATNIHCMKYHSVLSDIANFRFSFVGPTSSPRGRQKSCLHAVLPRCQSYRYPSTRTKCISAASRTVWRALPQSMLAHRHCTDMPSCP